VRYRRSQNNGISVRHPSAKTQYSEGDDKGMARVAADASDGEVQVSDLLRAAGPR
jgi:hypothetical protein